MYYAMFARTVALIVLGLLPPAALAAGLQALNVPTDGSSPALSGAVWYPCALAPTVVKLGPLDAMPAPLPPRTSARRPPVDPDPEPPQLLSAQYPRPMP
jgi:hypothetical protein